MIRTELEFEEIHATFRPKIYRYLARLVGEHEAEDLTQEVFIKVGRTLGSFRGESQLSTWIYRIATNTAMDRLRSPSFRQTVHASSSDAVEQNEGETDIRMEEKKPGVEQQIYRKEMNECIQDYIMRLPENYRVVLTLSELEGLNNKEVADILGKPLSTVKITLHRARTKLKEDLAGNCESYWLVDNEFLPELRKDSE